MEAPRLTAVVVLPTPPFWFATARTLPMPGLKLRGGPVGRACGVCSLLNGVVLRAFTTSNEGWPDLAVSSQGGSTRNGAISDVSSGTPLPRQDPIRPPARSSTERPLHRHPGPPRKALRRGRHLAEHVQRAVAGRWERLDRNHVLESKTHFVCRPPPEPQCVGANPPLPDNQHAGRTKQRRRVLHEHGQRRHRPGGHRLIGLPSTAERNGQPRPLLRPRNDTARIRDLRR